MFDWKCIFKRIGYTVGYGFTNTKAVGLFSVLLRLILTDVENQLTGFASVTVSVGQACVLNSRGKT